MYLLTCSDNDNFCRVFPEFEMGAFVGIAGPGGVGKGRLAYHLADELEPAFLPICLDCFVRGK